MNMFYKPGEPHNLPRDPFKACVIVSIYGRPVEWSSLISLAQPRPIGWISSVSKDNVHNLAPYSQFNNLTFGENPFHNKFPLAQLRSFYMPLTDPPYVMFSANQTHKGLIKDSVANAQDKGFFVWNLATWDLREAVNKSAMYLEPHVDEFDVAGITKEFSEVFPECPRVQESPVHFDCRYHSTVRLPGNPPMGTVDIIIAEVVGIHIKDEVLTDGILDVTLTKPIARLGYNQYAVVREAFEMSIPINEDGEGGKEMMSGLEGSAKDNRAMQGK